MWRQLTVSYSWCHAERVQIRERWIFFWLSAPRLPKARYFTVCTDQCGRRSPPRGLILVHTNGMPEHNRHQIDYRLVSIGPARLCNQVSTLIDEGETATNIHCARRNSMRQRPAVPPCQRQFRYLHTKDPHGSMTAWRIDLRSLADGAGAGWLYQRG